MNYRMMVLICAFASTAAAQLNNYLGPGIITRGAGDIGTRSGQQVDLRFFADVSGIYDNGIQPISLDKNGNLLETKGLEGVEASIGAYGVHQWRRALLGLDYHGGFRHYPGVSSYDGSDHQLLLGYTYQKSRRLYFNFQEIAGTYSRSLGSIPGVPLAPPTIVDQPTLLLFDNRTYFLESGMDTTVLTSARTSLTFGGTGFLVRRQSRALVGMNGYSLHGSIQRRVSRITTVGVGYEHSHYDFPRVFGQSDSEVYQAFLGTQFGKRWTFSLRAGVFQTEVQGLEQVTLDPAVAALLGITSVSQTFYAKNLFPYGGANLSRQFKNASFDLSYERSVSPGNGVYLTSRTEGGQGTFSYTGVRKFSFSVSGGENSLASLGQSLKGYRQVTGAAGVTYAITRVLHVTSRYDARHQEIDLAGYRRTSYRVSFGLAFSPGNLPLSLW